MNHCIKKIIFLLTACFALSAFSIDTFAMKDINIIPYYENAMICKASLSIKEDIAEVRAYYSGNTSTFLRADISVKLQKRILLAFWKDVNIGYTDNVWTDSSIFPNDTFSQSFAVDGTGYYRALITVKFYGTTGVVDTVEFTEEFNYN